MNREKKCYGRSVLIILLSLLADPLFGYYTQVVNGISWNYTVSGKTASVGTGSVSDPLAIPISTTGMITVPSRLGGRSVTSIAVSAFKGCVGLTGVTIPEGVTSIGEDAFSGCSGLTDVTIPDSVTNIRYGAFDGCDGVMNVTVPQYVCSVTLENVFWTAYESITNVVISDSVTEIGDCAFWGCVGLTGVTIPGNVTSIGDHAFYGCVGLTSVTIPGSVTSIKDFAFKGCSGLTDVIISDGVTGIGKWVFSECSGLKSISVADGNATYSSANGLLLSKDGKTLIQGVNGDVTIPDSVTSIGEWAFSSYVGLTSVTIPDSVTSIRDHAFSGCGRLTDVTIPGSVTSIGDHAFSGCSGLTDVTIPDSVTDIGPSAFYGCAGLTGVTIPEGVTSIGFEAFTNCRELMSISVADGNANYKSIAGLLLSKDGKTLIQGVNGDVTIPEGVTSIGPSAFYCYVGLTGVTIPDGVTSIGYSAFRNCIGLTEVVIPDSVTSIGSSAFYGCVGLTGLTIPDSVTSIEDHAFYGCGGLTNVTFLGNAPPVGSVAFYGLSTCAASVSPRSTGWGVEIGGYWNGLKLTYWPEPLTAVTSDVEIGDIMATFADKRLAAQVSTVAEYDAFRAWVNGNNLYQPNVIANTNVVIAYLLGAERLFLKRPIIEIGDVEMGTGVEEPLNGQAARLTLTVSVKDGKDTVRCAAEKVKEWFEATRELDDWDGAAKLEPNVSVETSRDDLPKMWFTVSPKNDAVPKFFLRVKVRDF